MLPTVPVPTRIETVGYVSIGEELEPNRHIVGSSSGTADFDSVPVLTRKKKEFEKCNTLMKTISISHNEKITNGCLRITPI